MYQPLTSTTPNSHFDSLRNEYPFFEYQSYCITEEKDSFRLKFNFNLANKVTFEPEMVFLKRDFFVEKPNRELLETLAFHIGMVELISYWKAACPPIIIIKPFQLTEIQLKWWKKLYYNGLGEFFFVNNIQTSQTDFVEIRCDATTTFQAVSQQFNSSVLVPIGGGKDSAVSLELLQQNDFPIIPLIVNPRVASSETVAAAGLSVNDSVIIQRSLDKKLLQLNAQGYLNGHTPFSALLAFSTAFAAVLTGSRHIALSNESSASEATVHGADVNHQYSKSYEFENDFRYYLNQNILAELNYFSLLRPINEIQIASLFSKFEKYHAVFKSCNVGSKTDSWCCNCSKCLFTYLILSPFIPENRLKTIFGTSLFEKTELQSTLDELLGKTISKPFECVGTVEEVKIVTEYITSHYVAEKLPILFQKNINSNNSPLVLEAALKHHLSHFDAIHFLEPEFEDLLRKAINEN